MMRSRFKLAALALALLVLLFLWFVFRAKQAHKPINAEAHSVSDAPGVESPLAHRPATASASGPTNVYAHNLMLRKGPSFRIYVRWLRGQMARAHSNVNPSFDDPDSFSLDIKTGVIRANIGDIANYLNAGGLGNSPLKNVTLSGNGDQIKLNGTLHKIVSLPIEVDGTLVALPDSRIQLHVTKLNVLKVPLKGLLGGLHISVSDLFHAQNIPGVRVAGNDIFFDTQTLLPPPHIRGHLTRVHIVNPDLEEIYGDAQGDVERVEEWRNFLRLSGGTIDFGKLTMHHVDLIMIDISKDVWFDLDLAHYQQQLVNGSTRMTPQAGLQIFMPDLREVPQNKATQNISIEWFKHRDIPPPADVLPK
jgi:hypothetical protein